LSFLNKKFSFKTQNFDKWLFFDFEERLYFPDQTECKSSFTGTVITKTFASLVQNESMGAGKGSSQ